MKRRSVRLNFGSSRLFAVPVLAVLAACSPAVPDSGAGVGFQDYNSYVRGAAASSAAAPAPIGGYAAPAPAAAFDPAAATAAFDRAEGRAAAPISAAAPYAAPTGSTLAAAPAYGAGAADRPRGDAPMGIKVQSGEVNQTNPVISDENDFNAVSQRESIASDAERIARNRAEYVVVQPKDLPQRAGDTGPNIVQYALATSHAPGVQMYSRGGLMRKDANSACAKFASPDQAQQQFLAKGGPDKDRLGVDPDGDGFACGWDPRPFRAALQ